MEVCGLNFHRFPCNSLHFISFPAKGERARVQYTQPIVQYYYTGVYSADSIGSEFSRPPSSRGPVKFALRVAMVGKRQCGGIEPACLRNGAHGMRNRSDVPQSEPGRSRRLAETP